MPTDDDHELIDLVERFVMPEGRYLLLRPVPRPGRSMGDVGPRPIAHIGDLLASLDG
jgi:hypothetical protein